METILKIAGWCLTNIFGNAAIFMGILVLIGLIAGGKKWYEALSGFIKAVVGYMVFNVASNGMLGTLRPILFALQNKLGANVIILDSYYSMAVVKDVAANAGKSMSIYTTAMVIAFALTMAMVYLKKITKFRCVNIAGNTINGYAMASFGFALLAWPEISDFWLILWILAFYLLNLVVSNLILEDVQEFTDGAGFTIFHVETFGINMACRLGDRITAKAAKEGKEVKRWAEIEFPGWLSIFDDITVSSTLVMTVVFGTFMTIVGKETLSEFVTISREFPLFIFETCCTFGCYIVILTTGIRMFVSELTVAFNAFSEKILRGGIPAVDIACIFGFMDNPSVLTIGFFCGTIFCTTLSFLSLAFGLPYVAIMGFTSLFFEHGGIAVFADKRGGIKCQLICNAVAAFMQVIVGGFICYSIGCGAYGGYGISGDWATLLAVMIPVLKTLGTTGIVILLIVAFAIPQIQYLLHKDTYFLAVEDWEAYKKATSKE